MSDRRIEDELAIRDLVERYADAVTRRDEADFRELWAEDGVWNVFGNAIGPRDAVLAAWSAAMQGFAFVFHIVHSAVIEVEGDQARGRWMIEERLVDAQGGPGMLLALYHDTYRREEAGWRFVERKLEPLYHGPPDLSGPRPD